MNNNKALIRRAPLRVALTGGLASGKSYALEFFKKLGFATISSDEIVNKLYLKREVVEEIRKILPNCIVDDKVDKKKIGESVFSDIQLLKALECIIHPLIQIERDDIIRRCYSNRAVICEIPLLFETKQIESQKKKYHLVISIITEIRLRIKRAVLRKSMTLAKFNAIILWQVPDDHRLFNSDIAVFNTDNRLALKKSIRKIVNVSNKRNSNRYRNHRFKHQRWAQNY